MPEMLEKWQVKIASLRLGWLQRQNTIVVCAIILMFIVAVTRLGYEFWRLVGMTGPSGAIDLRLRYEEVSWWFSGQPVYIKSHGGYPPASFVMLWPFVGWLTFSQARCLWAVTSVLALCGIIYLVVRESGVKTKKEKVFWILTILSVYPFAITIGNGQLGIHILFALIVITLVLDLKQVTFHRDLLAAVLFILSLTKISLSVPFLWLLVFLPGRFRPVFFAIIGYGLLTLFGLFFRSEPLWVLFSGFFTATSEMAYREEGAHLARWMTALGWMQWTTIGSFIMFGLLGVWVYRNRSADRWVLLGVTGIVARLWTYHHMYDDLLIILPMVALFFIVKEVGLFEKRGMVAGILFACAWIGLEIPGTLGRMSFPWNLPYDIGQTIIWSAMLVFLVNHTRQVKRSTVVELKELAS